MPVGVMNLPAQRAVLWSLLVAKVVTGWGVQWDIQWHVMIGRDSFWIPPHVMTYAGVAVTVVLSFGLLAWTTFRAPRVLPPGLVSMCGIVGTRGVHIAAWGIAATVLAAPIDDLWHRLFGLDVTLWSPPHLLGIFGSAVNTVGCLAIARDAYPAGSRARLLARSRIWLQRVWRIRPQDGHCTRSRPRAKRTTRFFGISTKQP